MAGIYIPGMDMPTKAKDEVITIYPDGTVLKYSLDSDFHNAKSRAFEVQPHGRLIDADDLTECDLYDPFWQEHGYSHTIIDNEPTIIPADPEEGVL